MLPDSVEWVLEMLGFDWPKADEDKLMESAQVWRDFADTVDELHYRAAGAANNVRSANSGDSIEAFGKAWEKFSAGGSDGYLADAATASRLIAAAFDAAAMIVIACKIAVIAQLVLLAVEIIAAQAAAPFTLGLSELGAAGAVQATKMIVRRLLKELRDALVEAILETLKEPVVSAVQAMISDLIAQTVNQGFGAQDGFDLGRTGKAGAEEFVTAVKNSGQTFTEALRDGLGSRAGGHARGGLDSAAGHGSNADSAGNGDSNGSTNAPDSSGSSPSSSSNGPSSSSNPSSSGDPSSSNPSSTSPSGSSPSGTSPSSTGPSSNGPSSSSTSPDSAPSRDTSGSSETPRSTQQTPTSGEPRSSAPLDPFGTRVGAEANTPSSEGRSGPDSQQSSRTPDGDTGTRPDNTPSRTPDGDTGTRPNSPAPEGTSRTPDHDPGARPAASDGPSRTPDAGDTRPHSGPSETAGPSHTPDGDTSTRPNSSSPDGPSRTPDHDPGTRPTASDGPSRTPDSGDSRPHAGPSENTGPTRTPDHDPGSRPAPAESTPPPRGDDSRPSYGPVRPADPTPSHTPAPADIPAPRHEPAPTRPDAAPQPAAATPDARTPAHTPAPEHGSPEAGPSRVDPRTAFADPASGTPTTPDSSATSAPRLNTAGGATVTAPPQAGPDHRPTPQPTPDTATPAATPGGVPGGMPHAGNPAAANPTTPAAARPTAPPTPTTAPTVQPQRRPDHDGPTLTPRPAADRSPATNRPDIPSRLNPTPRPEAARPDSPRPDIPSRLGTTSSNTRPDAARPDATRPDVGSRLDPTGSSTPRPDGTRPDATRPDIGSRLDPSRSDNSRPDATRPDGTRSDIPSRLDPTDSNTAHPDTPQPDSTKPDIGSRLDPTGQDSEHSADHPTESKPEHERPLSESRPYDTPGGLDRTDPQHQQDLESRVPRNPDGTPQRHPDPNGDWPGAVNGDGHRAPGRDNNCLDVALSTADTYSGNPTAAAPRNDTGPDGEQGGRDRAERQLGAPFRDMGDGDQAFRRVEDQLRESGHGSQAVIVTQDGNGRAHAWNVVNHDGKITYLDNQTGQRSDKPLHNGDNGVFAVALDPDRRPLPAADKSPEHGNDGTDRRPVDPAGQAKDKDDSDSDHEHQSLKDKHKDDPDHPSNEPARSEHERLKPAEQTDNLVYGVAGDQVQQHLRETNDVHRVDMEHVHQQLKDWANSDHLGKVLDRTTGDNPETFRRSDLEKALPGFKDMNPGEQGAVVAAMGRMSESFHEQHGAGMSPEPKDFPYSPDPNEPGPEKGQDEKRSRGHVDHEKTKTDAGLKQSPDAAKIRQEIKETFEAKSFEAALDQAVHRPDLTGKNYAVMEVYDPKTKEISYIVESSVPPSTERAGIPPLHSETHLGTWHDNLNSTRPDPKDQYQVLSLYTEREPCGRGAGHANCSGFLSTSHGDVPIHYGTGYRKGDKVEGTGVPGSMTPRQLMNRDFGNHVAEVTRAWLITEQRRKNSGS